MRITYILIIIAISAISVFYNMSLRNNNVALMNDVKEANYKRDFAMRQLIEIKFQNNDLRVANTALIEVCDPSQFRKAASKSIPKLKKV